MSCPFKEPDCFNCPYEDCIATVKDINRQNRIQTEKEEYAARVLRNKDIIKAYEIGVSIEALCSMYSLSISQIRSIIKHSERWKSA